MIQAPAHRRAAEPADQGDDDAHAQARLGGDHLPHLCRAVLLTRHSEVQAAPCRHARPGRLPAGSRRAQPGWKSGAQPRLVRDELDGAAGGQACRRDPGQEHDRPGRVPPDRGGPPARRDDDRPAVQRPRQGRSDRHGDDRLLRGDHAGDARPQALVAASPRSRRKADRPAQHGDGCRRPHLLGQVHPLLRGRGPRGAVAGGPLHDRCRAGRATARRAHDRRRRPARDHLHRPDGRSGLDRRAAGRRARAARLAGPAAHRRRLGRLHRTVRPARAGLGLSPGVGALDQRLQPQVRAGLSGYGDRDLPGQERPTGGAGVPHQLPRRGHAQLLAELLPARPPR